MSPPPGRPRPAPVLFAPATAAEGLSGGWGGDTGGAGGRAGARTGAARGNGRGAEGPRRALFTSRRQSSRGGQAAGEARPGRQFPSPSGLLAAARAGTTGCTPPFFYSHSPPALRRRLLLVPGEPGCDHNLCLQQNNKKPRGSWKRAGPVSPPGSSAGGTGPEGTSRRVSWAPRAPRYRLCLSGAARGGRTHSKL